MAVCVGLLLNHHLIRLHTESLTVHQAWAERLGRFSELSVLAGAINAPGNDIFDSHDADSEEARMQAAIQKFETAYDAAVLDLAWTTDGSTAKLLYGDLQNFHQAIVEMIGEAQAIFKLFRNAQEREAGGRMATMDRKYAKVNGAIIQLNGHVRDLQIRLFNDQLGNATALSRLEWLMAIFVVIMVTAVTYYGHKISKVVSTAQRERDIHVQELGTTNDALTRQIQVRKQAEAERDDREVALQTTNEYLENQINERERLTNGLTSILKMTDQLLAVPDLDTLWKRGMALAHEQLGLERGSIYEHDPETNQMTGTYAIVDLAGEVVSEQAKSFPASDVPWLAAALVKKSERAWRVHHDVNLYSGEGVNQVIGQGWAASTPISRQDGFPSAVMFNDSAITHKPFDPIQQDLIGVYCTLLGGILERKRAEAKLEENVKELRVAKRVAEESSRIKSEFLATVSHELRTPLNAIIGFSDMLLMGINGDLNPKQRHKLDRLRDNGMRLLTLINNVLDLTRLEAKRVEITYQPFSPQDLVKRLCAQMEVLAQQKGLVFNAQIDERVPASLLGDEQRIEQVVVNLLSNAFKFTETGSVTLSMMIAPSETAWIIRVADTGMGIPPHALNMIFEEFRQVDGSSSRTHKGSGLGLAITRNLIRLMKGEIAVTSEIGQGSVFSVTLPLIDELATHDQGQVAVLVPTEA